MLIFFAYFLLMLIFFAYSFAYAYIFCLFFCLFFCLLGFCLYFCLFFCLYLEFLHLISLYLGWDFIEFTIKATTSSNPTVLSLWLSNISTSEIPLLRVGPNWIYRTMVWAPVQLMKLSNQASDAGTAGTQGFQIFWPLWLFKCCGPRPQRTVVTVGHK